MVVCFFSLLHHLKHLGQWLYSLDKNVWAWSRGILGYVLGFFKKTCKWEGCLCSAVFSIIFGCLLLLWEFGCDDLNTILRSYLNFPSESETWCARTLPFPAAWQRCRPTCLMIPRRQQRTHSCQGYAWMGGTLFGTGWCCIPENRKKRKNNNNNKGTFLTPTS